MMDLIWLYISAVARLIDGHSVTICGFMLAFGYIEVTIMN